jgi:hypothetical protein
LKGGVEPIPVDDPSEKVQDSSSEDELVVSKKRGKPKQLQKESGDDVNMSALCVFF